MPEHETRDVSSKETALRTELARNQSYAEKYIKAPIQRPVKAKEHIEKFSKILKEICTEVHASISKLDSVEDQEVNVRVFNEELFVFEQWIEEFSEKTDILDQEIKKDGPDCQAQTVAILGLYNNYTKTV